MASAHAMPRPLAKPMAEDSAATEMGGTKRPKMAVSGSRARKKELQEVEKGLREFRVQRMRGLGFQGSKMKATNLKKMEII